MPTRSRTPYRMQAGCSRCGNTDPSQFYSTSTWCKRCHKAAVQEARLRKLGLTTQEHAAMYEAQEHRCAACKGEGRLMPKGLHTDHDHATGKARGLLCMRCNQVLGRVKDDAALLRALAEYITR